MKPLLEELWNGTLSPKTNCGSDDPELIQLQHLTERNKAALYAALDPQQIVLLEKYLDCSSEYLYFFSANAFSDGFCLGLRLMGEALGATTGRQY